MTTVDFRTRHQGDAVPLDIAAFLDEQLPSVDEHRSLAGRGVVALGLPPLTLHVEGEPLTFSTDDHGALQVRRVDGDALVVAMDAGAFSDLVQEVASTFGLQLAGRADVRRGARDAFVEWDPVLRALLDGRPVHEPGWVDLVDAEGRALDLHRSFTLDDDPHEMGEFLAAAGFLHVAAVFTDDEMAEVSTELDRAIEAAEPDDGASWWAETSSGESYPARILGFNQKSPTLRALLTDERFATLGTLTDDSFVQRNPDVGDSAEGLLKKVGVVEGISDVSWHKDCAPGGHSRGCCGLTTGISVTGAGPTNGELGVVPGSHRANVPSLGVDGLDLPRVPLPTQTGDVTIHCSCTLHMSRPPVSAERRVVYTGFALAPRPGDEPPVRTPEEIRRARLAQNDYVRRDQRNGDSSGARVASHEL